MEKPELINIDNNNYYLAENLFNYDTAFFYGCSRIRTIIDKKRLSKNDFIFGYKKTNMWIKSSEDYMKSKLLLTEEWTINNVPKMMENENKELYKYEEAPDILLLNDDEKFKDENDNIIELEVRGEKKQNNIYFKVKDVSEKFEMENLQNTLNNKEYGYIENKHYKNFIIKKQYLHYDQSSKNTSNLSPYLHFGHISPIEIALLTK